LEFSRGRLAKCYGTTKEDSELNLLFPESSATKLPTIGVFVEDSFFSEHLLDPGMNQEL
jgi:hypothetical protein